MLRHVAAFTAYLFASASGLAGAASLCANEQPPKPRLTTGRIEGSVIISTSLVSRRPRFRIYGDRGPGAQPPARSDAADERRNVVIYLQGDVPDTPPLEPPAERPAIHQEDEQFSPHILPVVRGTSVDFPNDDEIYHNVFSLSSAQQFDLGRYARGASRTVTFNRLGTVQVFCHIHADMSAIVLVLANPFFASPDERGQYVIDGVPEGEYTIVGWHERIRPIVHHVRVRAGETSHVAFDIPLPVEAASR